MFLFKKEYEMIKGDLLTLSCIKLELGNEYEIPYYWYDIILNETKEIIGKISIRIGHNYHSYFNGNIGYEIDEPYRGHHYALEACKMVLAVAKAHQMTYIYLCYDEENVASYKTIEQLGGRIVEIILPPKDYFGYYEGMSRSRIYQLDI